MRSAFEQLAFVFVNAFYLTIEDRIRIHDLTGGCPKPVCEPYLGFPLTGCKTLLRCRFSCEGLQSAQFAQVCDPPLANDFGDRASELRICLQ